MQLVNKRIIEWHLLLKYNYVIVIDPMIDLMLERFFTIEIILLIGVHSQRQSLSLISHIT